MRSAGTRRPREDVVVHVTGVESPVASTSSPLFVSGKRRQAVVYLATVILGMALAVMVSMLLVNNGSKSPEPGIKMKLQLSIKKTKITRGRNSSHQSSEWTQPENSPTSCPTSLPTRQRPAIIYQEDQKKARAKHFTSSAFRMKPTRKQPNILSH